MPPKQRPTTVALAADRTAAVMLGVSSLFTITTLFVAMWEGMYLPPSGWTTKIWLGITASHFGFLFFLVGIPDILSYFPGLRSISGGMPKLSDTYLAFQHRLFVKLLLYCGTRFLLVVAYYDRFNGENPYTESPSGFSSVEKQQRWQLVIGVMIMTSLYEFEHLLTTFMTALVWGFERILGSGASGRS